MNELTINTAYERLGAARTALHNAFTSLRLAKYDYEIAKAAIITTSDPKALGSNETIRAATIDRMLMRESEKVRECEQTEYDARLSYDLASIDVKSIETIVAWMGTSQG